MGVCELHELGGIEALHHDECGADPEREADRVDARPHGERERHDVGPHLTRTGRLAA